MKKKNYLTLDDEFIKYCELNNIADIDKLAKEVFNKGFTFLKYGDSPIIKKWEESGVLDGAKPMAENSPLIKFYEPNPIQKIPPSNDLYSE